MIKQMSYGLFRRGRGQVKSGRGGGRWKTSCWMLVLPGTTAGWEVTHKCTKHMAVSSSARIPINSHNRDRLWLIWADPEHVHACCSHTLTTGSKSTHICNRPMQTNEPFQKRQALRVQQIIRDFTELDPPAPQSPNASQSSTGERDNQDFSAPETGWLSPWLQKNESA